MIRRQRQRPQLTIHRYPDRPCVCEHQTWSGDYQTVSGFNEREVMVFINSHTPEYLQIFCEKTPVMDQFLATSETRGIQNRLTEAIRMHFKTPLGRDDDE